MCLLQVSVRESGKCSKGNQMVGTAAKHLESGEGAVIDLKHDVHRILSQHSYAHPYTTNIVSEPNNTVQIKEENNDKGDIFYASFDDANDCVTIEVPCEDQALDEVPSVPAIKIDTDFGTLTENCLGITLECDMKLLSPMSLSPNSVEENLLAVSPTHTSLSSDLGYESLASPLSETDSMDLSDFWCESFSELFPGLA